MEYSEHQIVEALKLCTGHASFRPLQREAVQATLEGKDSLIILPTGGGKSATFQLPPQLTNKITVVVSPLIALARDQVGRANARSCRARLVVAGSCNSTHGAASEWRCNCMALHAADGFPGNKHVHPELLVFVMPLIHTGGALLGAGHRCTGRYAAGQTGGGGTTSGDHLSMLPWRHHTITPTTSPPNSPAFHVWGCGTTTNNPHALTSHADLEQ